MINDLLKYSKVTSNDPKCALVNLEKVLEDALINLIIPTEENNAVITYDSLPKVHGDEKLLILLLQNLVGNGIKYNDKKTPKIHISSIKKDNQYIISVKDNGIGIKPEYLERIFTIFQRLHGKEEYDGTGIGLSIAQKIVHQHHGEIWVESEPGKGSTFYFNSKIN
jgi:light-regulated signal transduction histidine kinase (bacteriophytochrome)